MLKPIQLPSSVPSRRFRWAALLLLLAFALPMLTASPARAQTYTVLYNFTDLADGGYPYATVTLDEAGNLYGTTTTNSGGGPGTVYKLTDKHGSWTFARLYNVGTYGGLTIGPNGTLYDINDLTNSAVFNLQPPPRFSPNLFAPWIETALYSLSGGSHSSVIFDRNGNIYGTTYDGGTYGLGTVFELSPSNGGYTETVLHSFGHNLDGRYPVAGLVIDAAGNLYGTTVFGGDFGNGTVFELSPSAGGWSETNVYSFTGGEDGGNPYGGLIRDSSGILYGATPGLYSAGIGGSVFKLVPSGPSWNFYIIYEFPVGDDSCGPRGTPAMDQAGALYDTTTCSPAYGSVFKLTPTQEGWAYTTLHDFGERGDGIYPYSGVTLDANGNIFGTTSGGGAYGNGIVFKITQ